jgi:Fe-Mn family superoxide dismutase
VTKLNNLIPGTKFENASLETIIMEAEGPIYNNAA